MKINAILSQFNPHTIIEIIDNSNVRLAYDYANKIDRSILVNKSVLEINPFLAELSAGELHPAIQIRLIESVL